MHQCCSSAIYIHNLSFAYGSHTVLKNIELDIQQGDFVCILGESGCGKSTLLQILAGLLKPSHGEIKINNKPLIGTGLDRGVVFQDYNLFPWLTTGKNMLLSLRQKYKKASTKELTEIILYWLQEVNLDKDVFYKYPFELSGGMRQRCAVCRAFALDPPILLMDEPFGALDAITRAKLQHLTMKLWQKDSAKKTIIFVTHDVDEAILLANKIYLFGACPGRVIYQHTFKEGEKPPANELFDNPDIINLRSTLLNKLNKDIQQQTTLELGANV